MVGEARQGLVGRKFTNRIGCCSDRFFLVRVSPPDIIGRGFQGPQNTLKYESIFVVETGASVLVVRNFEADEELEKS